MSGSWWSWQLIMGALILISCPDDIIEKKLILTKYRAQILRMVLTTIVAFTVNAIIYN